MSRRSSRPGIGYGIFYKRAPTRLRAASGEGDVRNLGFKKGI
jgi:hypothetical protein